MRNLVLEHVSVDALIPASRRLRKHSKAQIKKIWRSIKASTFLDPILINVENTIICGHGRWEAAKYGGLQTVPVLRVEGLTPEQLRTYAIAENRLGELSEWDEQILAEELADLTQFTALDITVSGFVTAEIDRLLNLHDDRAQEPEALYEEPNRARQPVTQLGDIWDAGSHRIICQNAASAWTYSSLLGNERPRLIIGDFPYNVPIAGHVSRKGHSEFAMASGEMSNEQFSAFLTDVMRHLTAFSLDGSIHFLFIDFRSLDIMMAAGRSVYSTLLNICVWVKNNGGLGSFYRNAHEFICVFKAGTAPHINNVELGKHGRNRTNVWRYRGANSFGKGRNAALAVHPTVKPVDLISDAILDGSELGDVVLDPFLGSGTTLIAAERVGRRGFGIEIDPHYVDAALARIHAATGIEPIHRPTGLSFSQLAAKRALEREDVQ